MALDDLQGVIERLQDKIKTHRSYLSGHETRTRQVLIDPLLRELGWDVSDPEAVQLEYRVGQQWADYALVSNGQPVALIEAKRLGSNLEDDEMMQVLNYANRDGIDYMIVTDGDKWEMYEVFKRGALEERLLMKFQLSQQLPHKNALQALAMWKPNLVSEGSPSAATESALIPPEPTSDRPGNKPDEPLGHPPPDAPSVDSANWCTFESKLYPQRTKPDKLKIGDGLGGTVTNWKAIIRKVVTWLADEEMLSAKDCPIGTETYTFIGTEEVNPNGTPLRNPKTLSNGLILQRDYVNTIAQWQKLRQLLGDLEVDRSTIQISYRSL